MKWMLIVFFFVLNTDGTMEWQTAEELGRDGWYRMEHPDAESCIQAQNRFTENNSRINLIRASCDIAKY